MRSLILISQILLLLIYIESKQLKQFKINLDLKPQQRYKSIANFKKQGINQFINYLYTIQKYQHAFTVAKSLSIFLIQFVGIQFYRQCQGIANAIGRHTSQLVVFNYMYELGSYNKFCTSITVQVTNDDYFLARNLDYGYQQFLAQNSVLLTYIKGSKTIFQTVGHAGLIGAHTGMRFNGYSITFNERIDGGFHKTLEEILLMRAETMPYLIQKALRMYQTSQQAERYLIKSRTCSSAYLIINSRDKNIVIEKQRVGIKGRYEENCYLVQTNTDREMKDPDGRRNVAENKMEMLKNQNRISRDQVYKILATYPNKNNLTLITAILDTSNNRINGTIWI